MTVEKLDPIVENEVLSKEEQDQINADLSEINKDNPPEKEAAPEVTPETPPENNSEDDQLGPEHDDKTEEEREAIRARRRKERADKKNFRKEKEDSYKREIETLRKQVGEMNEWKNTVEQRRVQSGVAQLDKALKDSMDALEVAKKAMQQATDTNNGAALVDAQELYFAARKRAEDITRVKQQIARQAQQPPQQNINPEIIKHANSWMEDKKWYNPQGSDPDSRIALTIDNTMAEEGWDPRKSEYWEELDNRLKKYLPHRYTPAYNEPHQVEKRTPPTGGSSKTVGGSSGSNFTLSPERVRAMKEAGMWEDPSKRQAMIRRYIEQDRKSKSN